MGVQKTLPEAPRHPGGRRSNHQRGDGRPHTGPQGEPHIGRLSIPLDGGVEACDQRYACLLFARCLAFEQVRGIHSLSFLYMHTTWLTKVSFTCIDTLPHHTNRPNRRPRSHVTTTGGS